jgi:hypothetical protein
MEEKNIQDKSSAQKRGFLAFLADFLFGAAWDSQRAALKKEYKQLVRATCNYYNFRKNMVNADFAALLYKVYETVFPLRKFFLSNNDAASYVPVTVSNFLSAEQQEMLEQFSDERLSDSLGGSVFDAVKDRVTGMFDEFKESFQPEQHILINNVYNAVMELKQFCTVDYYAILRVFAPSLPEGSFPAQVQFSPVYRESVAQQLADFISALYSVLQVPDWKEPFALIGKLPGSKSLNADKYTQLFAQLRQLQQKNVFVSFGRLVLHDASYEPQLFPPEDGIVNSYLDSLWDTVSASLDKLYGQHRQEQQQLLAAKLFDGNKDVAPPQNYSAAVSSRYTAEGLPGFTRCTEFFHVHAFVELYAKTEIARFMKVFAVRAVSPEKDFVSQLALGFHDLLEKDALLVKTELQLSPKFQQGYKLSVLFQNIASDRTAEVQLRSALKTIDSTFVTLVEEQQGRLCKFEDYFRALYDDRVSGASQLIENWDELDNFFKEPVEDCLSSIYSCLHDFALLVDCYN